MRSLIRFLVLVAALCGLTGAAMADISPSIEVRLVSPFVAVGAGDSYSGRLEIACDQAGTLSGFELKSDGWSASLDNSLRTQTVRAGDKLTIDFTAHASDPTQRLEFACDFDGYAVRYAVDLSEQNVRNMTEGAPVERRPDFLEVPGDRSYGPMDILLGGEPTAVPRDGRRIITVAGRFGCTRRDGSYLPAHSIKIEVWDADASGGDDLMGTGFTNFDGYYSIDIDSNDGDGTGDPDIYVDFTLENSRVRVYEPSSGANYLFGTGVTNNFSGTYLDLGSLIPSNPDDQASVSLHTQAARGWAHDFLEGYDVSACRVEWPSAAWPNCSGTGRIQIRDDFSWSDGTLWHEYGHWFDHEIASWEPFNYCNGVCDDSPTDCGHCFWCQESEVIAWLEGWAQFHSWAVSDWVPGYYGATPLGPKNAEDLLQCDNSFYDDPTLTEGFIAALNQDIADFDQDSHGVYGAYVDRLAGGAGAVFEVCALDNPTGSMDFINKYLARHPGQGDLFWETAANCGYDLDNTAPGVVTSLGSGSHTAGVASPDPTVYMLWNRAPDNLSGIAGYGLFIASNSPGIPSAVMDIGDLTTYTTEALSPGTYYFCIRAVDNAGYWSGSYANWGPIVIREPDPADVLPYLAGGWDFPLVPRTVNNSTVSFAPVSETLPGDVAGTYWNIFGQNQGEAPTGVGFHAWLYVDGDYDSQSAYWGEIGAGGLYYGPNRGPITVQAGRHSFACRHDATDVVAEVVESNNEFGRQFIWTSPSIEPNDLVSRPAPPLETGGWNQITSGSLFFNCDGLRMPTTVGWWHAMAVWAESDSDDFDCRLHNASTGAQDGFATNLAYSARGAGALDAVVVNLNQVSTLAEDVGVLRYIGDGDYKAYHANSLAMFYGDSITVTMGNDVPILLREFYLDITGPMSVTASGDPDDGSVRVVLLHKDFTHGTLTGGNQVGSAWTDASGFARIETDLADAGYYCIMVYRDQSEGLPARDVTLEISTTPADLAPWTPGGWYTGMVPRAATDGTNVWCPAPDTLYSAPDLTYLNVAAQNLGPVPSAIPTQVFRDDIYHGYINWGELPAGATVSYNWSSPFAMSPGRHVLALRTDALNEIEETNESNNTVGEQWIWAPDPMVPGDTDFRVAPPVNTAGWSDITSGEPLWYNCDGLRFNGGGGNYWRALAILPQEGSDFDLRLHEIGTGAKDGFGASLAGSYEAGTRTEYLLVDFNTAAWANYDVGVLRWDGAGTYRVHDGDSQYLGDSPIGTWGPFAVPASGLVDLIEFGLPAETYTVTVENLSGADLGLSVHMGEVEGYQNRLSAVAGAAIAGPGEDEVVTFEVAEIQYFCLVVYREDQGSGEAQYQLRINGTETPVHDDSLPQVTQMAGAWPNPFNPQTTVAFDLAQADHARVLIYDLQGRVVRRLVDEALPAGRHTAVWQGRDDSGRSMASGVYFARLEAESGGGMTKLVLVK